MKIQLASDLHLEYLQTRFPGETLVKPHPQADLLVLAGDIANGTMAFETFRDWPVPVLYVAGNHEFYDEEFCATRRALQQASRPGRMHFLDDEAVTINDVRFLGTTLWTDYALYQDQWPREEAMERAKVLMRDHSAIKVPSGYFMPEDALALHEKSRSWLEQQLRENAGGPTVVITHHAPHPLSIHDNYQGDVTNAAFITDLSDLLPRAQLWLHGHVHNNFDYHVAGCRVVTNPRGYPRNRRDAADPGQLQFENPAFMPQLIMEV